MPVRYLISHPYALRGWKKLPYALQNYSSGQTDFFRQDDFSLLQCCDGQTVIDREKLTEEETKRISHWLKNGFIRECAPGERLAPYQEYRFYPVRFKKKYSGPSPDGAITAAAIASCPPPVRRRGNQPGTS